MSSSTDNTEAAWQSHDVLQDHALVRGWTAALAGDGQAQAQWQVIDGGEWVWQHDGVWAGGGSTEWSGLGWQGAGGAAFRELKNFVIEVTVSGKAEAVGLSFGPYKDFLTALEPGMGVRRLMLEVDTVAGRWAFRINGQLMNRCWWDAAVDSVDDLLNGMLMLKGRRIEHVLFQDLAVQVFQASCQLSVIMICHRFLQRLRVTLRNWCHQSLSSGAYEVLVVNPHSPDGTHEHLAAVASSYPHVRVREVVVEPHLATNKGVMINRAIDSSRGQWIWLTDADCLFSPTCAAAVLEQINGRVQRLFYGQRRFLAVSQTDALLAGRIDGLREFDALATSTNPKGSENVPWGYTQIFHRSTFERVRYHENINHFAHTDGMFVEECKRRGIVPEQVNGLFCLHLDHSFAWYGTNTFL
jgi:glycosyl transferase family 2